MTIINYPVFCKAESTPSEKGNYTAFPYFRGSRGARGCRSWILQSLRSFEDDRSTVLLNKVKNLFLYYPLFNSQIYINSCYSEKRSDKAIYKTNSTSPCPLLLGGDCGVVYNYDNVVDTLHAASLHKIKNLQSMGFKKVGRLLLLIIQDRNDELSYFFSIFLFVN